MTPTPVYIFYVFLSIFILLVSGSIFKPSMVTKLNIKYFTAMLKLLGYDAEIKETSPGKPEKIVRIWNLILIAWLLLLLILVSQTIK